MNTDDTSEAFEYVAGTLRDDDRIRFIEQLAKDCDLQVEVRFWEEQLMALNAPDLEIPPRSSTWQAIRERLDQTSQTARRPKKSLDTWLPNSWRAVILAGVLVSALMAVIIFRPLQGDDIQNKGINVDYIAVLTDDSGNARLTAITGSKGDILRLQWDSPDIPNDVSFQLWAVSKRDGQSRALAVFEERGLSEVVLDETTLRLIRDSSQLLLTEEELGGSAIDEPSDRVLAKGDCIRLLPPSNS
jgi:anti-sigma-K factor RskA